MFLHLKTAMTDVIVIMSSFMW